MTAPASGTVRFATADNLPRKAAARADRAAPANEPAASSAIPPVGRHPAAAVGTAKGFDNSGPSSMLDAFLVTVVRLAGANAGAVRALSPDGDKLRLVAAWGLPEEVLAREALIDPCGVCGDALRGDGVQVADDPARCGKLAVDAFFKKVCTGTVAVPLEYKGRSVGVFTLFFDGVHSLRGEVIHLLRPVGQLFGLALENARLERENLHTSLVRERQTMAAEIHDSLAQSLTFMRMRMPLLQDAVLREDQPRASRYCKDLNEELGNASRRVRELVTHFRAGMDADGLQRALEQTADTFFERTGIAFDFDSREPVPKLSADREIQVYYVVQEALANVRRHSGAGRVCLRIERAGDEVVITVQDDGRGFPAQQACGGEAATAGRASFGLEIMRDRANSVGGSISFDNPPDGGARVQLRVPVAEPAPEPAATNGGRR
jgi:two-component system nitrate/nitrite sensor histidine kinase NarX